MYPVSSIHNTIFSIIMLDLSVIILTYNEEIHIRRCLENVCPIAKEVFLIDCFSTDRTIEIAKKFDNVTVLQHEWPNRVSRFRGQVPEPSIYK